MRSIDFMDEMVDFGEGFDQMARRQGLSSITKGFAKYNVAIDLPQD